MSDIYCYKEQKYRQKMNNNMNVYDFADSHTGLLTSITGLINQILGKIQ